MAVYVTSDIHGHLRALDRVLEMAQPGAGDRLVFMGDMVDRGPDPIGVLKLARDYPGATVLMGNHEQLLLGAVAGGDEADTLIWQSNGGYVTSCALDGLPAEEAAGLVDWIAGLPAFAVAEVDDSRLRGRVRRRPTSSCTPASMLPRPAPSSTPWACNPATWADMAMRRRTS